MEDDNIIKINTTGVANYAISTSTNTIKASQITTGSISTSFTISPYPYDAITTYTFPKENPEPK